MSGDDDGSWHDQHEVILAARSVEFRPSSATSSTYTTQSTSSTNYTLPGVQTSEDNPVLTGPPPMSTPPAEGPGDGETTSTATTDPYLTTTPTNAGHI